MPHYSRDKKRFLYLITLKLHTEYNRTLYMGLTMRSTERIILEQSLVLECPLYLN